FFVQAGDAKAIPRQPQANLSQIPEQVPDRLGGIATPGQPGPVAINVPSQSTRLPARTPRIPHHTTPFAGAICSYGQGRQDTGTMTNPPHRIHAKDAVTSRLSA